MWLKSYLDLGPNRALWAYVQDANFAARVPNSEQGVDISVRMNPLTQSWKTSCGPKTNIKLEGKSLLDTAKTFQVRPEGIAFSREILRKMPIWYHREADAAIRRMNHWDDSICLRKNHKLRLVGEAEEIEACRSDHTHRRSWDCNCDSCVECREALGCQDPDACYKRAGRLLDQLPYKWDPRKSQPEDHEDQADGADDDDDWVLFDRQVTVTGQLGEIFRIFTEGEVTNEVPDMRLGEDNVPEEEIATDGSCFKNGYEDATAGAGVFYGEDNPKNQAIRLPATLEQTNQTAEMVAMKEA
ncbi:hypothetical protein B0H14DRAFT_2234241, partial [Mycena olivaceomarginata]